MSAARTLLLLATLGPLGCRAKPADVFDPPAASAEPPSARIAWVAVAPASEFAGFDAPARVVAEPGSLAAVSLAVSAKVLEVHVAAGDAVKAGDALVTVQARELAEASAKATSARRELDVLDKRRAVLRPLVADGLAKAADLHALDLDAARLEGVAREARAVLDASGAPERIEGGRIKLVSPLAGVVTSADAVAGAVRSPGDGPLVVVSRGDSRRIEAQCGEAPGSTYELLRSGAAPVPLRLLRSAPDPRAATFVELAWFEPVGNERLPLGTRGVVRARPGPATGASFVIPTDAIVREGEATAVEARSPHAEARREAVTVLGVRGVYSLVAAKLQAGDEVRVPSGAPR